MARVEIGTVFNAIEQTPIGKTFKEVKDHPLVSKIYSGVNRATSAWWDNVDLRKIKKKDLAWRIGLGIGVTESMLVLAVGPGGGLVKGIANAAAIQTAHLGSWGIYRTQKLYYEKAYSGTERDIKIQDLDQNKSRLDNRIRSFFRGVSAGALYGSLSFGIFDELSNYITTNHRETLISLYSKFSGDISPAPQAASETGQMDLPEQPKDVNPQTTIKDKIIAVEQNPDFTLYLQSQVGKMVSAREYIIEDVLTKQGKSTGDLSPQTLSDLRKVVSNEMENKINKSAREILSQTFTQNPSLDINSKETMQLVKDKVYDSYFEWFTSNEGKEQLRDTVRHFFIEQTGTTTVPPEALPADIPPKEVLSQTSFSGNMTSFVTENQGQLDIFQQYIIQPGDTAGDLVLKMGAPITWDGTDWEGFAVLKALNPDLFQQLSDTSGLSQAKFDELVKRIKSGDRQAYNQLLSYMSLVRVESNITLLTPGGLKRFLQVTQAT